MDVLDLKSFLDYIYPMITTVTGKNQVTLPAKLARQLDFQPGQCMVRSVGEENILTARLLPRMEVSKIFPSFLNSCKRRSGNNIQPYIATSTTLSI